MVDTIKKALAWAWRAIQRILRAAEELDELVRLARDIKEILEDLRDRVAQFQAA